MQNVSFIKKQNFMKINKILRNKKIDFACVK